MNRRQWLWGVLFLVMAGVVVTSARAHGGNLVLVGHNPPATATPAPYPSIPAFELIDQTGHSFVRENLNGRVWVVDFIFTSCAGECPVMSERMLKLQRELPAGVRFASISVDPGRDTPAALSQYAKNLKADANRWVFLTGSPPTIESLVKDVFLLSYAPGFDPREPITHSTRFVLLDKLGRIRGSYDSTEPKKVQQLVRDAKMVLAEKP